MTLHIPSTDLRDAFRAVLGAVLAEGARVEPRGLATRELHNVVLDIREPHRRFFAHPSLNEPLIALKQELMLAGVHDPEAIATRETLGSDGSHSAAFLFEDLADVKPHLEEVFRILSEDPQSRQAVLPVFATRDEHRRLPITVAVQYLLRDGALHATTYMRSNDLWKGLLTDVHFLVFLQEVLASWLDVSLGTYTHIIGAAHVYEKDIAAIEAYLADADPPLREISAERRSPR